MLIPPGGTFPGAVFVPVLVSIPVRSPLGPAPLPGSCLCVFSAVPEPAAAGAFRCFVYSVTPLPAGAALPGGAAGLSPALVMPELHGHSSGQPSRTPPFPHRAIPNG